MLDKTKSWFRPNFVALKIWTCSSIWCQVRVSWVAKFSSRSRGKYARKILNILLADSRRFFFVFFEHNSSTTHDTRHSPNAHHGDPHTSSNKLSRGVEHNCISVLCWSNKLSQISKSFYVRLKLKRSNGVISRRWRKKMRWKQIRFHWSVSSSL